MKTTPLPPQLYDVRVWVTITVLTIMFKKANHSIPPIPKQQRVAIVYPAEMLSNLRLGQVLTNLD